MIPRTGITVSKKELLGLLIVFIVYVLLGGLVFMLLESPLEEKLRRDLDELRNEFHERNIVRDVIDRMCKQYQICVSNLAKCQLNTGHVIAGGFYSRHAMILRHFVRSDKLSLLGTPNVTREDMERLMLRLAEAHSNSLIDEEGNDTHINWSFSNSFFFAITVVTTIGYGHLSPSTTPGRLFCILYAMIGIPLTGILLAAIGGHYSQRLVRGLQRARKGRNSRIALVLSALKCLLPWLFVFLVVPAGFFMWLEEWSFVESFYYCFITLSTIGFGDYVASNFEGRYVAVYKTFVVLWIIFGLGYLAMILNYISRMMRCKQIRRVERKLSTSIHHTQQKMGQRLDEVYQILQDVSRNRTIKPRNRAALKRMQSFPAPELKDRNHNHKIQKLLALVQTLREEEPSPRPRRLSLPLPNSPTLQPAMHGRGSLQVFTSNNREGINEILRNGFQKKPATKDLEVNVIVNDISTLKRENEGLQKEKSTTKLETVDVISAEPPIEALADRRTIINMEGLQCTEV